VTRTLLTTSPRGLDWSHPALRLWRKAKKHGVWDPDDIDFSRDREDWAGMTDGEREVVLHVLCMLEGGEESVTLDLLPLIDVVAREGRLEEEMFLTAFLWEEAKHLEVFRRFLDEVAGAAGRDLAHYHTPSYRTIVYEELPRAMRRLAVDPSPAAQAEASVTYNLIVEGVLAETAYHAFHRILARSGLLPGLLEAVALTRRDESRHLAYGVFLLSRLVAEHGEPVWEAIERRMGELVTPALMFVPEIFACHDPMPFGLDLAPFAEFAMGQYERRARRIERARRQSLAEVVAEGIDEPEAPAP
jgi:ribonucleoside-diphosphate reductase beta chain